MAGSPNRRVYNVQSKVDQFIIGEYGTINKNSGQTLQGVRYTAIDDSSVDPKIIFDTLQKYFQFSWVSGERESAAQLSPTHQVYLMEREISPMKAVMMIMLDFKLSIYSCSKQQPTLRCKQKTILSASTTHSKSDTHTPYYHCMMYEMTNHVPNQQWNS